EEREKTDRTHIYEGWMERRRSGLAGQNGNTQADGLEPAAQGRRAAPPAEGWRGGTCARGAQSTATELCRDRRRHRALRICRTRYVARSGGSHHCPALPRPRRL